MNNNIKEINVIRTIILLLVLVPIVIVFFITIISDKDSIVLFENCSPIVSISIISFYFLLCFVLFFYGIYKLVLQIRSIIKLRNEKMKAELMLLKSQISPHFFFNMLNNLYGLVVKDSQKAQELILKLSDMMRYSIYEGEKETINLREEIGFLKNYIELHKMRYHKQITVNFYCDVDEKGKVVPLLFIILLENAFKHGVENLRENAYVKMSLTTSQNEICFSIENNYQKVENQSGIGLKNLKKRLELIYPNEHKLTFSSTEDVYQAQLILKQL